MGLLKIPFFLRPIINKAKKNKPVKHTPKYLLVAFNTDYEFLYKIPFIKKGKFFSDCEQLTYGRSAFTAIPQINEERGNYIPTMFRRSVQVFFHLVIDGLILEDGESFVLVHNQLNQKRTQYFCKKLYLHFRKRQCLHKEQHTASFDMESYLNSAEFDKVIKEMGRKYLNVKRIKRF